MRARSTNRRKSRKRGFVLLESIVAFAILATMLAVIYRAVGAGARGVERAENVSGVLALLQSDLDRLVTGPPLRVGVEKARLNEDFDRTVTITKVAVASLPQGDPRVNLFQIDIEAFRKTDNRASRPTLALRAIRLQRSGEAP